MQNSNRNLFLTSLGAVAITSIFISNYLFFNFVYPSIKKSRVSNTQNSHAIVSSQNGQACVNKETGNILWNCANATCTTQEIYNCTKYAKELEKITNEETLLTSNYSQGQVAGIETVACETNGFAGQNGCTSFNGISVIGQPIVFKKDLQNQLEQVSAFSKSASASPLDKNTYYDVNINEPIRLGIKLKNNSSTIINDKLEFFVLKVNEAPLGTKIDQNSQVCEAQLNALNTNNQMSLSRYFSKTAINYSLKPNEEKIVGEEWVPTKKDCGIYQIELGTESFGNANKTCPTSIVPTNRSVVSAFVRVNGNCELPQCNSVKLVNNLDPTSNSLTKEATVKAIVNLNKSANELQMSEGVIFELTTANLDYLNFNKIPNLTCTSPTNNRVTCTAKGDLKNNIEIFYVVSPTANLGGKATINLSTKYLGANSGVTCTNSMNIQEPTLSCIYNKTSEWVEQYREFNNYQAFDVNSPARLVSFVIPNGENKRSKVRVKYEFAPIGDKTTINAGSNLDSKWESQKNDCGPQSNEEAGFMVIGEHLLNKTYQGEFIFEDNLYEDTVYNKDSNSNPLTIRYKELSLNLLPGTYSISAKWLGDGNTFLGNNATKRKYFINANDITSKKISYEEAVIEKKGGETCKWSGSYLVRASYCIESPQKAIDQELQTINLQITNNSDKTANLKAFIHGVELLLTKEQRSLLTIEPNTTMNFEFLFNNQFTSSSVLEILPFNNAELGNVQVKEVKISSKDQIIYQKNENKVIKQEGLRIKYK